MDEIKTTKRNFEYRLKVRQQPKHSRMCGFGEKVDRRPIDPPPIIVCVSYPLIIFFIRKW
ncbi:hypothetical protein BC833DRAFT_590360 [Globomyces pollinis-pini]|nr:hypothetical protein BC833DRAFT_590360 [Globomyces pollinis-pini]